MWTKDDVYMANIYMSKFSVWANLFSMTNQTFSMHTWVKLVFKASSVENYIKCFYS